MYRDKLAALDQAKQSVTMEKQREIEQMKERLEQVKHDPTLHDNQLPRHEFQRFLVFKQVIYSVHFKMVDVLMCLV
jgi:hypothetical protein